MTEQTKAMRWFRLYHELLRDRKIARVARMCDVERAMVIGVWTGILILASESPERGYLFLAPNVPFTIDDLPEELGTSQIICERLVAAFRCLDMLSVEDGVICVTHFFDRQFESDSSTARVREYRERTRAEEPHDETAYPTVTETPSDNTCNVTETLQQRDGNAPEHSRADTEQIQILAADKPPQLHPKRNKRPALGAGGTEQSAMFGTLCEVCVMDGKIHAARVGKHAAQLVKAGYAAEDVRRWYSPGGWWYARDWRGKQNQAPSIEQVGETIAKARKDMPSRASPDKRPMRIVDPDTGEIREVTT